MIQRAWRYFSRDQLAGLSLSVVLLYGGVAVLAAQGWGIPAWDLAIGGSHDAPRFWGAGWEAWLGTDQFGRSVLVKTLHGARTSLSTGCAATVISVSLGICLGTLAGFCGGKIDAVIVWFYSVLSTVPAIMLLIAIAFVFGRGEASLYLALGLTSWVSLARVVRAEVIRLKSREFVLAAESLGVSALGRVFKHLLPNVLHLAWVQGAFIFLGAVKSEVVLSYLGLGAQGRPSWGVMIDDARVELLNGIWWQVVPAVVSLMGLVLAFSLLAEALRDAFDPRS